MAFNRPAWVDLNWDGKPIESAVHGHGPARSPIHKADAFDPVSGDCLLEISGSRSADVRVMITEGG